jgi:branched-chain amino acid transport system permease protein
LSFEIFIQLTMSGLTMGAVYSLIALGFTTIYRSSNILNLAQGEFVMLGGLFTVFFLKTLGLPYVPAGACAVLAVAAIGLLIHRVIIHPIRDEGLLILIMITIGVSVFLSGSSALVFGPSPQSLPPILDREPLLVGGSVRINIQSLFVLGAAAVLLVILYGLSRFTFYGKAMEAVSTDTLGADLVGIPRNLIITLSFGMSAAIGALAGVVITPLFFTQSSAGAILGLKGFSAAVIGGWGRYRGAVLGGLILGVIESLSVGVIPAGYKDAIAFIVLLLILYFRPKGILGSRALEEARK